MLQQLLKDYPHLNKHKSTQSINKLMKVIINNDGSMTKTLQNLLDQSIKVKILNEQQMSQIPYHINQEIQLDQMIDGPYVYRQVLIQDEQQNELIFASSIWNQHQYAQTMSQNLKPIGIQLINNKVEYFRQILEIFEVELGETKLLARNYIIWSQNKPITYIEEVILPYLYEQTQTI